MEGWEDLEGRCREIIGWRMSLVPYISAAFQRYAIDGTPPFRALVLDTPSDVTLAKVDDQYMIGDRMMVAPMFAGEPQRKVVIPAAGNWHDFWTGALVQAGSVITVDASTTNIPVYVKAGSIVPWADVGLHAGTEQSKRVTARVYGDGSLPFELQGEKAAKLSWAASAGSVSGPMPYVVYAWSHVG
jgi:alpha-D-xyloside xylohydrolase